MRFEDRSSGTCSKWSTFNSPATIISNDSRFNPDVSVNEDVSADRPTSALTTSFFFLNARPPLSIDVFLPDTEISYQSICNEDKFPLFSEIKLTCCHSPDNFYWAFVKFQPALQRLMNVMGSLYGSSFGKHYKMDFSQCYSGQMVAVRSSNKKLYRAKIMDLTGCAPFIMAQIFYVDFGIQSQAYLHQIRHLQIHFTQRMQGLYGHLVGIAQPTQNGILGYSPDAINAFLYNMQNGISKIYRAALQNVRPNNEHHNLEFQDLDYRLVFLDN